MAEVQVTVRVVDRYGEPIEGAAVALQSSGFYDGEYTDRGGEVTYTVASWRTYSVWVKGSRLTEVGVGGGSEEIVVTWEP